MIRRVLVALVALIAVMLADVPRTMGQTPAVCRVSCKDSKKVCYGQAKDELAARLGACAGGPPPRRKCRRQAKLAALAERSACRGFMRECHTCCAADGSECSVGCGDGTVSSERGEECDPPGASCEAGAVCDSECHCPATATTTSTTATTLVTSTTLATTTTVITVTTTTAPSTTTTQPTTTSTSSSTSSTTSTTSATTTSTSTTTTTVTSTTSTTAPSTSTTTTVTSTSTTTTTIAPGCHFPATGQTTCTNASGTTIPCAGTGQDGELQKGSPLSYTDNGNGTITDDNTGLVWEKLGQDGSVHDVGNTYTWDQAFAVHVAGLNTASFAGHNDWRLPNERELESILDYGAFSPSIATAFNSTCTASCSPTACSCTTSSGTAYWSSTTNAAFHDNAWSVDYSAGLVKVFPKSTPSAVRAVRGSSSCLPATGQTMCWNSAGTVIACAGTGQDGELRAGAPLSYTDNGDGTVTDDNTGLVWEKLSLDSSVHDRRNTYTWSQAFSGHVATLNGATFAGHTDWRVPNEKELESIVNFQTSTPAVSLGFNNSCGSVGCTVLTCSCTDPSGFYWSSTSYAAPASAWVVLFDDGSTTVGPKSLSEDVRAVRGGS